MENRDFKGIWISKEIWLNTELSANEKVLLAEISSLDNENHCVAGNEYFANFLQVSVPTVTRAIKHLEDLGFIEVLAFDGRHRVIKMINQPNQNDEAVSSKRLSNNINSNIENNKVLSKDNTTTVQEEEKSSFFRHSYDDITEKPKKKKETLWDKCYSEINNFTNDTDLRDNIVQYLKMRLEIKDKPLYFNMWKSMLNNSLASLSSSNEELCKIVQYNTSKGYLNFYPIPKSHNNNFIDIAGKTVIKDTDRKVDISGETF